MFPNPLPRVVTPRSHLLRSLSLAAVAIAFFFFATESQAIEAAYRYFRFTPTKLRDTPTVSTCVQISEFEFRYRGSVVSLAGVTVTNPGGNNPTAETPAKVADASTATKWLDFNKSYLVFTFPARTSIDGYNFATANDSAERDPVSWRIEGSDDGSSWSTLDSISDFATTTVRNSYQRGFYLQATGMVPGDPVSPQWNPEEILNWNPASDPNAVFNRSTVPLASRVADTATFKANAHARANEARVMPLIAFNTTPGASAQGSRTMHYYTPLFWQYMRGMTFWGGSDRDTRTILAPSAHIVDAAHRNGVPVLGKVFFAFSSDAARLALVRSFLQKTGSTFPVADKLIAVANYYGFDGWFINQETSGTTSTDSQNMRDFIKYLRAQAPNLEIMWYDAMVESGARSFQNALTDQNDAFLKEGTSLVAETMFLNFWWGSPYNESTNMPNSRQKALTLGLDPYDVYAGIDTEGGGSDTNVDWTNLFPEGQPHRLSLGIYRPEWTFNYASDTTSFHAREMRYWVGANNDPSNTTTTSAWKGIAHYIPEQSAITSLPFVTNFNVGQGSRYVINGSTQMTSAWSNLNLQDILPTWRWMMQPSGTKLTPSLELDDAYYGGTSLKIAGTLDVTVDLKLYRCRLPISAATNLRIVYKRGTTTASGMQVGLTFEDAPTAVEYLDIGNSPTTGWNPRSFSLLAYAGRTLAAISLRFANATPISGYSMRVGQLAISDGAVSTPAPITGLTVDRQDSLDGDSVSLRLKWTHSTSAVRYYNVSLRNSDGTITWLGATSNNAYFVPYLRRKDTAANQTIDVQAVALDFGVSSRLATTVTLPALPNMRFPLSGTYIGTAGSYMNFGDTGTKVFDGNTGTFFDAQEADGAWAGLDLGAGNEKTITAIRYFPRTNWGYRMTGGVFQASNTADFSDNVLTLASVPISPKEGAYTVLACTHPGAFRYVRYLSPNGGHANVAEIQFYGVPLPSAPSGLTGKMVDGKVTLNWNASTYASSYSVKRGTSAGGPFAPAGSNVTSMSFSEDNLSAAATYYYVVTSVNEAGESANSAVLAVSDSYALWLTSRGGSPGAAGSGFGEDRNGDGVTNGVEYAAPGGLRVSGLGASSVITADVRTDSTISVSLLVSTDLANWTPLNFAASADQSGAPAGFTRYSTQDTAAAGTEKRFYRLKLTR